MTLPKESNNLKFPPHSDPSILKCDGDRDKQRKKKRGPTRRSVGLETSSVVPPPEIPRRDNLSMLENPKESPKDPGSKDEQFSATLVDEQQGGTIHPSSGVQRHLSTTSTVPPPPPSEGLRRHNGTQNVHPGAVRMSGLRATSLNTIQIGDDTHPSPSVNGPMSTNPRPPTASHLVRAFLVEDSPTAAVAPVTRRESVEPTSFSGFSRGDSSMMLTAKDGPVSAVPLTSPQRSFCDLLRDWRVLVLIVVFSLLVAAVVIGFGMYSGMNFSSSSNKTLEAQTFGPSVSVSPTKMPVPTPVPFDSISHPTQAPTKAPTRQTPTRAPVFRPTRPPTTYASPTRSPTKEPNSYEGDYEDSESDGDD